MESAIALGVSAFGLGVLHAFEPGHGKTLMAGSLVNSKRKWFDPFVLAFSTALGHMAGIFLFTALSYSIIHETMPEEVRALIERSIGLAIICIGCFMAFRVFQSHPKAASSCLCCSKKDAKSMGSQTSQLSVIGLLVGLVPCPTALALASSTVTLKSFPHALSISSMFGLGVAVALWVIGIAITSSAQKIAGSEKIKFFSHIARWVSPISLICFGSLILFHAGSHIHH